VIPVACNPEVERGLAAFPAESARATYDLPETYGLYPAQFWPHKNHARLIEALAIVRGRAPNTNLGLVLTGNRSLPGWAEASAALDRHNMRDHVRLLDYVPTEHLAGLYRAATFCVVPSLFEASSYPVIEAQMLGCPAMCSNVTSLPELMVDGAGLLFDPRSPEDIADKMLRFLESDDLRAECAERGRTRARREHSLEAYGTRVAGLYQQVLASAGRG
jgi:glycosyltransferase involved in cell wall biosynthesis